ncbi:MAG: hypothetical protein IJI38_01180 [Clostridia bacterium]|nr:hypothetical protein [Clostridia bacterium]
MEERSQIEQTIREEIRKTLTGYFNHEKERKLINYRQQNQYIKNDNC